MIVSMSYLFKIGAVVWLFTHWQLLLSSIASRYVRPNDGDDRWCMMIDDDYGDDDKMYDDDVGW